MSKAELIHFNPAKGKGCEAPAYCRGIGKGKAFARYVWSVRVDLTARDNPTDIRHQELRANISGSLQHYSDPGRYGRPVQP